MGRFQSNQYKAVYPFISERDGEYCLACFIEYGQKRGPESVKLEIDHANCNLSDWSPGNLHFLCHKHNIKFRSMNVKEHVAIITGYHNENERERVRTGEYRSATKRMGDYLHGSPEMRVNSIAEVNWLDFLQSWIKDNGSIDKDTAVYAGAIAADDINPQTTERYWKKHTSILGRFEEVNRDGIKYAVYRVDNKVVKRT